VPSKAKKLDGSFSLDTSMQILQTSKKEVIVRKNMRYHDPPENSVLMTGLVHFRRATSKPHLQTSLVKIYHARSGKVYDALIVGRDSLAVKDWESAGKRHADISHLASPREQRASPSLRWLQPEEACRRLQETVENSGETQPPPESIPQNVVEMTGKPDLGSSGEENPQEAVEMSVPGLTQLLETARVDKNSWPAIQAWCLENGAQELGDIEQNLESIAIAVKWPKLVVPRIRRHAAW